MLTFEDYNKVWDYTLNEPFATEWLKALRSGKYSQGTNQLCSIGETGENYCCLGVGTEVLIQQGAEITVEFSKDDETKVYFYKGSLSKTLPTPEVCELMGFPIDGSPYVYMPNREGYWVIIHLHVLNDKVHLTFSQIADLVEYFHVAKEN